MDKDDLFRSALGFQWDEGNAYKNQASHQVSIRECEEIFFNEPLLIHDDIKHSHAEDRYYALGETDDHRQLSIVFTLRGRLIRVISARDMSRKERKIYEQA